MGLGGSPGFPKGGPVKGLVLFALGVTSVEWDLLLKDNIRARDLPKGGAVKEQPARPLGVDANKNCWLGDWTKFAPWARRAPLFSAHDLCSPTLAAADMGTSMMPCLIGRDTGKHAMRDEVGKSGRMEKGVAPQVMGCATLHQTGSGVRTTVLLRASATPFCCGESGLENVSAMPLAVQEALRALFRNSPPDHHGGA